MTPVVTLLRRHHPPRDKPARGGAPRTRLLIGAVMVTLLAAAGGTVWLHMQGPDPVTAQPAAPAPAPPATRYAPKTPKSTCPGGFTTPTPGDVVAEQITPPTPGNAPGSRWDVVAGVSSPTNPRIGPAVLNPVRACYARSPWGAVFSAANYSAQAVDTTQDQAVLVRRTTAAGPGQDWYLKALAEAGVTTSDPRVYGMPQWTGYHFLAYTDTVCSLELAHTYRGQTVINTLQLRWEQGDWRVVLPADGTQTPPRTQNAIDSTFTPWAAQ